MFGIGMQEWLIILVLVLVIFGAGKIPQIGSALGKGIGHFKKAVSGRDDASDAPAKISGGQSSQV